VCVVCCSVLQCVAVCCSQQRRGAKCHVRDMTSDALYECDPPSYIVGYDCACVHCNILEYTATHCNTLQHTAEHCNTLQHTATHCNTLQHTATHCNTLLNTAAHCNTLQHTATHWDMTPDALYEHDPPSYNVGFHCFYLES